MQLADLLTRDRIQCGVTVASKKRALEQVSQLMATDQTKLDQTDIFDNLISRERLGSTGLGRGVAIPHARVKNTTRTTGAFIKLKEGIDYDAADRQPVDILFALLVPEESNEEHLQILSQLAQMFSDTQLVEKLRQTNDSDALLKLIDNWHPDQ